MRLATIRTGEGPRLHVPGRSGYADVAAESGESRLRSMTGLLDGGAAALEVAGRLAATKGREYAEADMAAAVPEPTFTTLVPGDVIGTGTPGGVGFARTPPVWLTPGDVVEVSIEGIGTIRNTVVAEQHAPTSWRWAPASSTTGVL